MKSPEELTDRFRSAGLKLTPQRQAVFRALHGSRVHPTAEAVHAEVVKDLPMVSLRTVYQTLNDLTAMGELGHMRLGTGSARFDPNLEPHHHLVCDGCGTVADLAAEFPDVAVPEGAGDGFSGLRAEIVFRGLCSTCQATNRTTDQTKEARERHG